jgi:EAL domain-containing protein (putative c-di-GMP-specific phosphodiesterase class I)
VEAASTSCIRSSSYADRVLSKLDEYGLDPSELKIEVVESVFLGSESHDVRAVLERLSAEGVRIALDDFGTGYASLSHLRDYPINCIKIDKSFVSGLGQSDSNAAIVQALIGLGRSMKLEVIAEGIETRGQLDFVSALGSDFGQGYLLARPMDARALAQHATGSPLRHPARHERALPANA